MADYPLARNTPLIVHVATDGAAVSTDVSPSQVQALQSLADTGCLIRAAQVLHLETAELALLLDELAEQLNASSYVRLVVIGFQLGMIC